MNNNSIDKSGQKHNPRPFADFGEGIKNQREGFGFSKEYAADQIGCGVSTLEQWEAGTGFPQTSNLLKLAELYQTPPQNLLLGTSLIKSLQPVTKENSEELAMQAELLNDTLAADQDIPEPMFSVSRYGGDITNLDIGMGDFMASFNKRDICNLLLTLGVQYEEIRNITGGWS